MTRFLLILTLALGWFAGGAAAQGPQPAAPALAPPTQAQAETALEVLRDDAKRAQLITVLEAIIRAAPQPALPPAALPAAPPAAPMAGPAASGLPVVLPAAPGAEPVAQPAPPPAEENKLALPLAPDSVGAQVLAGVSEQLSHLSADVIAEAGEIADFPSLGHWLAQFATNPDRQQQALDAGWRSLLVLAAGLAGEFAVRRALRRPVRALERAAPDDFDPAPGPAEAEAGPTGKEGRRLPALLALRRLPFALGVFLLDLVPVLVLLGVGTLMARTRLADNHTTGLVIVAVLHSFVLYRVVVAVVRLLVAPRRPRLRLLQTSEAGAAFLLAWTRGLAVLTVFGYTAAEIGLLFGLYRVAYEALLKLVSLAVLVCLVTIVSQSRAAVAARIRAVPVRNKRLAILLDRLAAGWHVFAIFYLGGLWLVWAFEVPNGFSRLLRMVASLIVVAVLARLLAVLAYGALDRALRVAPETAARLPGLEARVRGYEPIGRAVLTSLIALLAVVALFEAWGFEVVSWFTAGALGGRVAAALGTIAITLAIALAIWESANIAMQHHLARLAREAQAARSARLRTLLPMLRTTLLVSICTVAGLVVLSEIGINTAPLLAGAGVVGLAIGFGSQKLVQDIITGLFLLLENTMQVGDVVSLGGMSGTVEALSIRTIRLRALDGSVHIVPFSAVTTVTNQTRDFGYAVVDVSVGLNEDPGRVAGIIREVAKEMRAEPRWDSAIRDDLDVLGVEKFLDTALVLRTRIKTVPGQRWAVARELNQRIKVRFDELAVDSPWTSNRVLGTTPPPPLLAPPEVEGVGDHA
jgi:small-conductance mechanosensitive channel